MEEFIKFFRAIIILTLLPLLASCKPTPIVAGDISYQPQPPIPVGAQATFSIAAAGKNLSFEWKATSGDFIGSTANASVVYKAPDTPQDAVTVSVTVKDDGGQQITKNLIFKVVDITPSTETPAPPPTPTTIFTSTPSLTPVLLPTVFQNFEETNGSCIGPGCYFWDAFYMKCSFEFVNVYEGKRTIKCEAHANREEPKQNGGTIGVNPSTDNEPVDLSQATTLSVWINDTVGGNNAELKIRYYDSQNKEILTEGIYSASTTPTIKDTWTEISWDLSKFGNIDRGHVKNIEIYIYNDGVYYFDFVSYK